MHRSLVRCTTCRVSVLEAFTSVAGISIPVHTATPQLSVPRIQSARKISTIKPLRQALQPTDSPAEPQPSAEVPWYLQVEDPLPPTPFTPFLALQEIPPLPEDPPAILSPVLNHLSSQIGLDNLVLLDLRSLDPPPALGSNLIMIIGTARSVKHLNVSADRFCRWARKEYKLRPFADGLLGRNELKLKLRRKARRMKLAQSVGNTVSGAGADDGITTGWICVNLGAVDQAVLPGEDANEDVDLQSEEEPLHAQAQDQTHTQKDPGESDDKLRRRAQETPEEGEDEYRNPGEEDEYAGFGSRSNSPRIVVQMFVEEKRLEMDLEGLWDGRNTKRARKDEQANVMAEAALEMLLQEEESMRGKDGVTTKRREGIVYVDENGEELDEEYEIEEEVDVQDNLEGLKEEKSLEPTRQS